MFGPKKPICPLVGKPCLKEGCELYMALAYDGGVTKGCAFLFNVSTRLEGNRDLRQVTAAMNQLRNAIATLIAGLVRTKQIALKPGDVDDDD